MLPSNWPAGGNLFTAATCDAMRALKAARPFREFDSSLFSSSTHAILEQQRAIERSLRELGDYDRMAALAKATLTDTLLPIDKLTALTHATELHAQLLETTRLRERLSTWTEMQHTIENLVARDPIVRWDDIVRTAAAVRLKDCVTRQLARIADFDTVLSAAIADSSRAAWASHLRMTALPALSVLGQEWSMPIGLITAVSSELGASVSWLARYRAEPLLMMAAITPSVEDADDVELVVDEEVLCALCGGPMVTLGTSFSWIGPHRGVRRRRIFPACSECAAREREEPGFLYHALCQLTHPAVAIRGVIRGRGQGDGRPRGRLRLVRMEEGEDRA